MRCLGFAEVDRRVRSRVPRPGRAGGGRNASDYVVDAHLQLSAWARDAVALGLERILWREDSPASARPAGGPDQ